ncbi:hypothetical protein K432DRAFT_294394 [Lepidopterella palustris CBS 459.81]|uniref:MICOS complex subunit MIC12 n=1 Tax=Lepidopterella palustris CBS 459.81 TaxID=1314670 RepID=A0A8E2EDT8_9PEZI|nr:hypothetical protein K432DRAFT_294394 [Lepidopterella palustris CBS 459.81]
MGFATGFIGGLTLTSATFYLTLSLHTRNRLQQAALLRQQSLILTNIVDPQPQPPPPTARLERAGMVETAKDRWNGELEGLVRRVQTTDWRAEREQWEDRLGKVWGRVWESGKS